MKVHALSTHWLIGSIREIKDKKKQKKKGFFEYNLVLLFSSIAWGETWLDRR